MATLAPTFRTESERIHREHLALEKDLLALEFSLDRLVCYAEVFADLSGAEQVRRYGRRLAAQFPGHCQREEMLLLAPVSRISPELAEFVAEMKRQHGQLLGRLHGFCSALEELDTTTDLESVVCAVKEKGKELLDEVRRHVTIEESELEGFL
jgi:hypothetical protein